METNSSGISGTTTSGITNTVTMSNLGYRISLKVTLFIEFTVVEQNILLYHVDIIVHIGGW